MATIRYNITAGTAPFTVTITPAVHAPQNHSALGNYFFTNIPDNNYTIEVTDSVGCNISFNVSVQCNTTTTTTQQETTTTTTPIATTTTTTHADLPALKACLDDALIYEGTLSGFTPVSDYYSNSTELEGSGICEDDNYIFIVFNDTTDSDYKYHVVWRYNKSTEAISTQTIITTGGHCCNSHKRPIVHITSSGSLLVIIPNLESDGVNTRCAEVFRWADTSDLATYSSTIVGNFTTERLSYYFIYEINNEIILQAKNNDTSDPTQRFYKSTDDGQSFGAITEYLDYVDADWWMYSVQVTNNIKNGSYVYIAVMPTYVPSLVTYWKYITFLKTNFTNFYALDGTDLGVTISRTELENNKSWGEITEDTDDLYYCSHSKKIGNDIYAIGRIGSRPGGGSSNCPNMQIFKTNINTGNTTIGNNISTVDGSWEVPIIFNICDELYIKTVNNGTIYYYKVAEDLSSADIVYSEGNDYSYYLLSDLYSELTADYDPTTKILRVFRMSDPDTIWDLTTTTSTTGLPTSTTTSTTELPISTTTTTTVLPTTTTTSTAVEPTTTTTTTEIVALCDGLISCWEFDETSGTTAIDANGNNDGTIDGATINQTGKVDKAYDFDGADDLVNTNLNTHYTEFSFSCWIYLDGWGEDGLGRIFDKREAGLQVLGLYVDGSSSNNRIAFYQSRSTALGQWRTESSTLSLSDWYHICVTYDNSSVDNDAKIYINGTSMTIVEANMPSGTVTTNTDNYIIGNRGTKDRSFNGKIDQPAIWNKILNPSEVEELYNSGNGKAYSTWGCPTTTTTTT
jgi:hypothetical protein